MAVARQGKTLLNCFRLVASESKCNSPFQVNKWKLNARCFADKSGEAKVTVSEDAAGSGGRAPTEEELLQQKWEAERAETRKYKIEYYVVPTPFEKRLLVFTGTYASLKEVPDLVTQTQILGVKDRVRAKSAIILTILTGVVAYFIARSAFKDYLHFWDHEAVNVTPDFDSKKKLERPSQ